MSIGNSLIVTQALVKRYGDKMAVNNVSLEVQAGEVFGFLGPNGAGKTTTIKMIVGLLQPTSGTVQVAGFDVQTQPLQAKAASGYVPDTPNLYAKLTGRELLRFVGDLYGLDRQHMAQRTEELLRVLDLDEAADNTIDSYSHGMQQKASLAAALDARPQGAGAGRADRRPRPEVGPPDQGYPAPDGRPRLGGLPLDPHPGDCRAYVRPHRHHQQGRAGRGWAP